MSLLGRSFSENRTSNPPAQAGSRRRRQDIAAQDHQHLDRHFREAVFDQNVIGSTTASEAYRKLASFSQAFDLVADRSNGQTEPPRPQKRSVTLPSADDIMPVATKAGIAH
jgi:hypothetical protein